MEELTREQFLTVTGGREHDDEIHVANGVACLWFLDDRVYREFQPDIGHVTWSVYEN